MAILAAYVQKLRTGKGQKVEISMQEAMTYFMRTRIAIGAKWGKEVCGRSGNTQGLAPMALYPCKPFGANDWVFIMPVTAGHWDELCVVTGKPELLVDERFQEIPARVQHEAELYEVFASWTREQSKHDVMRILGEAGVPCSACLDTVELHNDPHLRARNFVKNIDHPVHGNVPLLGFAPELSASEVSIERAPLLGEHTDEVLTADLKLDRETLDRLKAEGVLG
jgi:formyl-CoA transferase